MAAISPLKAIAGYFNSGTNKKPLREFQVEIKGAERGGKAVVCCGNLQGHG